VYQLPSWLSGSIASRTEVMASACVPLVKGPVTVTVLGAAKVALVMSKLVGLPSIEMAKVTG